MAWMFYFVKTGVFFVEDKLKIYIIVCKIYVFFYPIYLFFTCFSSLPLNLHWNIEEYWEKKLVVDGHWDEPALIELRRSFPHHDTQSDSPEKDH